MEDDKNIVEILDIHEYMDNRFKIMKLKFPDKIQPAMGMNLIDSEQSLYTISGIIFESQINNIWDCKLEDASNKLTKRSFLRI